MNDAQPLRWSSPANAWAVGAQLLSITIPIMAVAEGYQPVALEAIAAPLADIWQWVLLVFAVIALVASLTMQLALGDGSRMQAVVRVEAFATAIVSACYFTLLAALVHEYGWGQAPLTQLLIGGLGFIALLRVGQIIWESWRYRRARRTGSVVTSEALAKPKDT
ncbi:hypothetical protein [Microbacterium sp. CJ88]|uniref:hypothetical protein n=1 Tax=Microbacterium sp. CJ88 TaxID=3445672 RepID=UPI003F65F503